MGISDKIEAFILELMKQEEDEYLKIQRNELAEVFGCVPSQINYVISTRFSPERGYVVISRRGGGGCVMIRRADSGTDIGSEMSEREANSVVKNLYTSSKITLREAKIMQSALSDASLFDTENKDKTRAGILKNILKFIYEEEL
ncbi:MAG: CtsR family transcriptional regulator [Clostridia bacterium]|nr:CtsR family transcriptional regulator [Clostridia bacterium]